MSKARILIFCADSRGLGHLTRLAHCATRLAEQHSVLIITSSEILPRVVRPPIEYVRIPPLDTSDVRSSLQLGRGVFMRGLDRVVELRTKLIKDVFETFSPHAMITDFFALGRGCELLPHLRSSGVLRMNYLILRGVVGGARYCRDRVFSPASIKAIADFYDRIFIACDARVHDAGGYHFSPYIAGKCINVGYVTTPDALPDRAAVRKERGLRDNDTWIVCSAGSGLSSEQMIERCYEVACQMPGYRFTIVTGLRSRLVLKHANQKPDNITLTNYEAGTSDMLASCDIAICHGGYNSMIEGIRGGASVIVVPNAAEDEQREHAKRLSVVANVRLVSCEGLTNALDEVIAKLASKPRKIHPELDVAGADVIAALIGKDMALLGDLSGERTERLPQLVQISDDARN